MADAEKKAEIELKNTLAEAFKNDENEEENEEENGAVVLAGKASSSDLALRSPTELIFPRDTEGAITSARSEECDDDEFSKDHQRRTKLNVISRLSSMVD